MKQERFSGYDQNRTNAEYKQVCILSEQEVESKDSGHRANNWKSQQGASARTTDSKSVSKPEKPYIITALEKLW